MNIQYIPSVTGTVISFIPNPVAKGIGFGMRGIAFGMSKAGV